MKSINTNSVSIAGEFAVLSQLALRGYDANLTLGNTKSVDILVLDPDNGKLWQLEVKTNFKNDKKEPSVSKIHGKFVSDWMMSKKHETIYSESLFYCFVNISKDTGFFKFYVVPSEIVAKYIREEHQFWIDEKKKEKKKVKYNTDQRIFRMGLRGEQYFVQTPTVEDYENKWDFISRK
ncbi:MAG: hypothetical protein WAN50_05315 [Minisyncoccia bacterium]